MTEKKLSQFDHNFFFSHKKCPKMKKNDRKFPTYFGQMIDKS